MYFVYNIHKCPTDLDAPVVHALVSLGVLRFAFPLLTICLHTAGVMPSRLASQLQGSDAPHVPRGENEVCPMVLELYPMTSHLHAAPQHQQQLHLDSLVLRGKTSEVWCPMVLRLHPIVCSLQRFAVAAGRLRQSMMHSTAGASVAVVESLPLQGWAAQHLVL